MSEQLFSDAAFPAYAPQPLPYQTVARAKRLMRSGLDLYETAEVVGVRPRDLDLTLWVRCGGEGW